MTAFTFRRPIDGGQIYVKTGGEKPRATQSCVGFHGVFRTVTHEHKINSMFKQNILRDYQRAKDGGLGNTALNVSTKMDGNPNFLTPSVKPADLKTTALNFNAAVGICRDGTSEDTLHKNALKAQLIALLDKLADYVEANSNNDPEIMASSGFTLASMSKTTPAPVGTVSINAVTNAGAGALNLDMNYGDNVWGFEVQTSIAPNVWVAAGYYTDPNDVTPSSLTAGQMYALRVRVHGSKNQVSDWSDVVSHMAI